MIEKIRIKGRGTLKWYELSEHMKRLNLGLISVISLISQMLARHMEFGLLAK